MSRIEDVKDYLVALQNSICAELEQLDGDAAFARDAWERPGGGGGESRVLAQGHVFEQAGVSVSHVFGDQMPPAATKTRPELAGKRFQAVGVSLVLHPRNPYVPTTHANFRFFTAGEQDPVWWFGGGFDLTPYYPFHEDVLHWHKTARAACEPFSNDLYPRYKAWCDEYFFIKHRGEARGVGGIFYDYVDSGGWEADLAFTRDVGLAFLKIYPELVRRHMAEPWTDEQRRHQLMRRGRYAEFNLLYDRGTKFGLMTGGNVEAILMSMPPEAAWP